MSFFVCLFAFFYLHVCIVIFFLIMIGFSQTLKVYVNFKMYDKYQLII